MLPVFPPSMPSTRNRRACSYTWAQTLRLTNPDRTPPKKKKGTYTRSTSNTCSAGRSPRSPAAFSSVPSAHSVVKILLFELLPRTMMIKADHPRELPRTIFLLPQVNEFRLPHPLRLLVPRMMKAVHTNLHCAIGRDRVHLERPRNQLPRHFTSGIRL